MEFESDYVTAQTGDIVISACQAFLEGAGQEDNSCGYYLRIENNSDEKIQILSKNFNITDDRGNSYCESGLGFKGEIPELEPGEYFEFSNSAPLNSAFGVLYGSCRIVSEKQNQVKDIQIPAVSLTGNLNLACAMN